MSCYCKCSVTLPHGALGLSAVCDCGISLIILTYFFVSLSTYPPTTVSHGVYIQEMPQSLTADQPTDRSKAVLLLWIFYVFVLSCVCDVLCASVYMCFVVTCWERADLLALVCGVFCEFVTFPLVSWVRCGT